MSRVRQLTFVKVGGREQTKIRPAFLGGPFLATLSVSISCTWFFSADCFLFFGSTPQLFIRLTRRRARGSCSLPAGSRALMRCSCLGRMAWVGDLDANDLGWIVWMVVARISLQARAMLLITSMSWQRPKGNIDEVPSNAALFCGKTHDFIPLKNATLVPFSLPCSVQFDELYRQPPIVQSFSR